MISKPAWEHVLLELTILVLCLCWLPSFFDQSILPGMPHTVGVTDVLSVVILLLILFRLLK